MNLFRFALPLVFNYGEFAIIGILKAPEFEGFKINVLFLVAG